MRNTLSARLAREPTTISIDTIVAQYADWEFTATPKAASATALAVTWPDQPPLARESQDSRSWGTRGRSRSSGSDHSRAQDTRWPEQEPSRGRHGRRDEDTARDSKATRPYRTHSPAADRRDSSVEERVTLLSARVEELALMIRGFVGAGTQDDLYSRQMTRHALDHQTRQTRGGSGAVRPVGHSANQTTRALLHPQAYVTADSSPHVSSHASDGTAGTAHSAEQAAGTAAAGPAAFEPASLPHQSLTPQPDFQGGSRD